MGQMRDSELRGGLSPDLAAGAEHAVRGRLAVLGPSYLYNACGEQALVRAGLQGDLGQVRLRVVKSQGFQRRDRFDEATDDARRLLRRSDAGRDTEAPAAMGQRTSVAIPGESTGLVVSRAVKAPRSAWCVGVS